MSLTCADTFGTIDFVGSHGHQVNSSPPRRLGDLAYGLSSVGVENTLRSRQIAMSANGCTLNFIIRCHHRNQNSIGTESLF